MGKYENGNNGDIVLIFLERVCFALFKYRENVLTEIAKMNMINDILFSTSTTRRGGKLDFISSRKGIS